MKMVTNDSLSSFTLFQATGLTSRKKIHKIHY